MNPSAEKLSATAQASVASAQALAAKTQAAAAELVELNMTTSKAVLTASFEYAKAVLGAKDPQEMVSLQAGLAKQAAERAAGYAQEIQKIIAAVNAEFTKAAQANIADVQKGFANLLETATTGAPAGSESAIAFFNNAMNASQNAFAAAQNSARQAVEAAQANFSTVTAQAVDTVKKASRTD